jgi:hypothetical protein
MSAVVSWQNADEVDAKRSMRRKVVFPHALRIVSLGRPAEVGYFDAV